MRAVTNSTRDYEALVTEKVLPWYEGERIERGENLVLLYVRLDFVSLTNSNTLSLTNGLYSLGDFVIARIRES